MAGVEHLHYPCEACGHPQKVTIGWSDGKPPTSLDRRPCDRCGGVLSSFPVGLVDTMERLVQESVGDRITER